MRHEQLGSRSKTAGEKGKLDSVNVPLFDLLRNFQITSALEYTTEARQPVFIGWINHLEVIPK